MFLFPEHGFIVYTTPSLHVIYCCLSSVGKNFSQVLGKVYIPDFTYIDLDLYFIDSARENISTFVFGGV